MKHISKVLGISTNHAASEEETRMPKGVYERSSYVREDEG